MAEASRATVIARRVARSAGADCYRNDNDGVLVITRADGEQMGVIDEDDGEGWTATERKDRSWEALDGDDRTAADLVERCVREWVARADVAGRALTATVSGRDAWGKERQVTVAWIPEDVTAGVNDVTGWPRVVVGTDPEQPPIGIGRSRATGETNIVSHPQQLAGQRAYVHEWSHAQDEADRGPGTYWIIADSDALDPDGDAEHHADV
ncbi:MULTISPECIES: hypothetical protein [Promicromonospora]|uniref:Uncharacterized protein n=2 Tax=Promicromonospora TaxID=43676 RepID=A0ABW4V3L9_9MICO